MDVGDVGQSHHMGCSWEFMVDYGDCIFGVVCSWYDLPQGRRLMEGVMTPERIGATPYFGGNDPFRIPLSTTIEQVLMFLPKRWTLRIPRYIAAVSPFVVFWDYKWLAAQRIHGSQVEGLREYRELQLIILIIRFSAWALTRFSSNPLILSWSAAFFAILSFVVRPSLR